MLILNLIVQFENVVGKCVQPQLESPFLKSTTIRVIAKRIIEKFQYTINVRIIADV